GRDQKTLLAITATRAFPFSCTATITGPPTLTATGSRPALVSLWLAVPVGRDGQPRLGGAAGIVYGRDARGRGLALARAREAVAVELGHEGPPRHPQALGGPGLVAAPGDQDVEHALPLVTADLVERRALGLGQGVGARAHPHQIPARIVAHLLEREMRGQKLVLTEHQGPVHVVLELADVAGPGVALEDGEHLVADAGHGPVALGA